MRYLALGLALSSLSLHGALRPIEVGETVPNLCYQNSEEKTVCLEDFKNTVRVLVFNAGY